MATVEVKLPDIGEGVNEGEIVKWLVKEGDSVSHDQPLVEVMTDKATVEIPSSADGKIAKLLAKEGDVVKVGGSLLSLEQGATSAAAPSNKNAAPKEAAAKEATTPSREVPARAAASFASAAVNPPAAGAHVLATPAIRRYAREAGVDLNQMHGTGPAGRITREDVMAVTGGRHAPVAAAHAMGQGAEAAARPQFAAGSGPSQTTARSAAILPLPMVRPHLEGPAEERKPFRGIRRKIAENLVRSKQIIPHFTHADEADATDLVAWRTQMKETAQTYGVKLTYLPFVMKALVATCREFPQFNASIDDEAGEVIYKHQFNVGFAADTPEGLLVPVVKNVESKTILEIAKDISSLAEKARAGKLAPDDMRHGSITVTNIGSVGGVYATPIINHPEVAIIGIYKIQKKPVVVKDEIVIRDMMGVTATCDHRLIDGAAAARFLNRLIFRIERPQSLLFDMV